MPKAHSVRDSERLVLLKSLQDKTDRFIAKEGFTDVDLHIAYEFLHAVKGYWRSSPGNIVNGFFWKEIQPEIKAFARCPEEEKILYGGLLLWIVQRIVDKARGDLHHVEITDPQRIFRAGSATAKVATE